ncbi:ABC transporter permease subunit [Siculibacillus lacustris]|uniref:ABC transporter permease subunit n=1 Tax=Siculibacillus lacustris TaxID=1549641 RepID=A0A4Q9VUN0_9HYPH|nr:ABC transporter permease subunit [Siculibacillus lacustris]TBW39463.1 ABC transporter permease subunit [Siculibacillus lacustris]
MRHGIGFWLQLGFTLLVSAFLMVPIGMSILAGFTENYFRGPSSGLTTRWIVEVWERYGDNIFLSLGIAASCLVVTILIGVPAAYVLAKRQSRLSRMFEELIILPVAIPGLATALALVMLYGTFGGFRSSWTFVLVGHVLYTLPFMVRSVLAVLSSIDLRTLEEGAASLGAGFWTRFWTIVLPNAGSGILAGSLMVTTLSIGEFNLTLLLTTPFTQTIPVGLAVAYTNARLELGSAYTVLFFAMIIPLLVAMQIWGNPSRTSTKRKRRALEKVVSP